MSPGPQVGGVSFWFRDVFGQQVPEPADRLDGDTRADVVIVGAGYTGLWTAYYLAGLRPDLDIRVIERRFAGFGASGRNGGWLTATVTGGLDGYADSHGRAAAGNLQTAMNDTVDEVIAVAEREGIDADIRRGGALLVARNRAQAQRAQHHAATAARWPELGARLLRADEAAARIAVRGCQLAVHEPHCARLHPVKLVVGLAAAVRRRGVRIHEGTAVTTIEAGRVVTDRGVVTSPHVIRATEGFTADLAGERRTWVPLNSSMIVTEPIPAAQWAAIGWEGGETLEDFSHVYSYAQRTADGRIAIGGRGNPYRFGSRTDSDGSVDERTIAGLRAVLTSWFPSLSEVAVAHAWSGVLGVPRTWRATVGYDAASGLGWAGGYVGTGVAATNLAGRTLAALVAGHPSELTDLPWVGQRARRWEPEPLRWLGIQALYGAYRLADRIEFAGGRRTSVVARLADRVSGRA